MSNSGNFPPLQPTILLKEREQFVRKNRKHARRDVGQTLMLPVQVALKEPQARSGLVGNAKSPPVPRPAITEFET